MKKTTLIIGFLALVSLACNENRIFESHTDPSGNLEWAREQTVAFSVDIQDASLTYDVLVALRFAQGFAFTSLPVEIKRTAPDGSEEILRHVFQTRNRNGSYNGEGAGDIWDLENVLQPGIKFPQAGTYQYEIRHTMDRDLIHMVMEVGLIVDKQITQQ